MGQEKGFPKSFTVDLNDYMILNFDDNKSNVKIVKWSIYFSQSHRFLKGKNHSSEMKLKTLSGQRYDQRQTMRVLAQVIYIA